MENLPQPDQMDDLIVFELPGNLRHTEEMIREELGGSSAFSKPELVRYTNENGQRRELILPPSPKTDTN